MRKITLMSGIPGSGKSTEAEVRMCGSVNRPMLENRSHNRNPHNIIVSADHHFMDGPIYKFDVSQLSAAHGSCLKSYLRAVSGWETVIGEHFAPEHVVVDNTFVSSIELAPYIALAQAYDIPVEVVTVQVKIEDVVKAHARNSHGVPQGAIERMWKALSERTYPYHWQPSMGVTFTYIDAVFR